VETIATFLYGNHELTFDDKFRLTIPTAIRDALDPERDGNGFFIVDGVNSRLWLWPDKPYRSMVSRLSSEMEPGTEKLDFDHRNFANADFQVPDKQNRIRIPERMFREAKLNREVMLAGVRDHLEIWNRTDWEARRAREIAMKAKQTNMNPTV
jgi:MraZ protein